MTDWLNWSQQALDGFFLAILTDGNIIYVSESVISLLEHLPVSNTAWHCESITNLKINSLKSINLPQYTHGCFNRYSIVNHVHMLIVVNECVCVCVYVCVCVCAHAFSVIWWIRICWTSCLLWSTQTFIRLCHLMSWRERPSRQNIWKVCTLVTAKYLHIHL